MQDDIFRPPPVVQSPPDSLTQAGVDAYLQGDTEKAASLINRADVARRRSMPDEGYSDFPIDSEFAMSKSIALRLAGR
jgi:hypothetical protein